MAIGWITILKTVPWADVISNAPKVADGAKKLWKTVAKKTSAPGSSTQAAQAAGSADTSSASPVEVRVSEMEARTAELHAQMLASSELINALAEQNAELVKRIEAIRVRVLWLGAVCIILVIITVKSLL